MKKETHYLTFYEKWGPKEVDLYMADIADHLRCSVRHAKTIIKQLHNKGWLRWEPASGRGRASRLTFLLTPEELEKEKVRQWIRTGNISKAVQWMQNQQRLEASLIDWLEGQLQWTPAYQSLQGEDVLSYPCYYPIKTLLPPHTTTRHEGHLIEHIYNRLVSYNQKTGSFEPELAHHWESEENGRIWRFYLHKGVRFHNGDVLSAAHLLHLVEYWQRDRPQKWIGNMLAEIEEVKIISSTIFEIHMQRSTPLLLHIFTDHKSMVFPVDVYEKDQEKFALHPVGTGPYYVHTHTPGHLVLAAHDHYFGIRPFLDRIQLYQIPKRPLPPQRQVHYRIGEDKSGAELKHYDWFRSEPGGVYVVMNHRKKGIHATDSFRRYVAKSLNRKSLFSDHPHHQVWFPDSFFQTDAGPISQEENDAEAKEWFARQGLEGSTFTLVSTCLRHDAYFGYELEQLQEHFQQLGLQLRTAVVDIHELTKHRALQQADMIIAGAALGANPLVSMLSILTSDLSFIRNTLPETAQRHLEILVEQVQRSPDTAAAYEKLGAIERYLFDQYYVLFLYQRQTTIHIEATDKLQGIHANLYNRLDYRQLWYKV